MSLRPTTIAVLPTLSDLKSSFRSKSRSDTSAQATKKRQRSNDDIVSSIKGTGRSRGRPKVSSKPPLNTTQEIRLLRAQVATMEEELQGLQNKWAKQLPNKEHYATAHFTAQKKHEMILTEAAHNDLQDMFLQQQLMFATVQAAIFRAPLHSSGYDIFQSLHFDTRLPVDSGERSKMFAAHTERSLALVPSLMKRFTQMAVDKVLQCQDESTVKKSFLPVSQIDITGCKDHTLVSSVFMSEIPHTSLEDVYEAVLAYHEDLPSTMKRHFGVDATRTRLNGADAPATYWQLNLNGVGLAAQVNHVMCAELTPTHGVFHMDAVREDPLYPTKRASPLEFGISGLTITPRKEPVTGRVIAVTLRWVVLYRYRLFPDDPALREDLEIIRPILNGDLITASVCGYIQELQQKRSP